MTTGAVPQLDPQIAEYLAGATAADAPPLSALTPDELRARVRASRADGPAGPEMHTVSEVTIPSAAASNRIGARLYQPAPESDCLIVFLHGGGWVTGDLETADASARRLASYCGADVLSVDYRLAPEHPFPAGLRDAEAAALWASEHASGRPLVVAGDSAGGNLAAVIAQGDFRARTGIAAQVLCYPVVDADLERPAYRNCPPGVPLGGGEMGWYWDRYLADATGRSNPRAAPLHSPVLGTAAPAVVVLAGYDPLTEAGREYASRLDEAGVPVRLLEHQGAVHGFLSLPVQLELRERALTEVSAALRELLAIEKAQTLEAQ